MAKSAPAEAPGRFIFIVGPHRSGSTVWHNLIAMRRDILRLTDPRFLGHYGQRDFRYFLRTQVDALRTGADVSKMVELCFSRRPVPGLEGAFWRFEGIAAASDPKLHEAVYRRVEESDRTLGTVARIILQEVTRFSGYERACVKFPVDVTRMPAVFEWFEDCRVVHITRDPRAVAASKSNDPSGTAKLIAAHPRLGWLLKRAALWNVVGQYRVAARLHKRYKVRSEYRLFRFEDLLAAPEATTRELCQFIGVAYDSTMLQLESGQHDHQPSSLTGRRQRELDPASAERWREAISWLDRAIVTTCASASMAELGYH